MANIMQDRPRGGRLFFVANPDAEDGGSPTTAIPPPLPPPPPPLPSAPLPVPSTSHIVSPIQSPPLTTPTTAPLSVSVPVRSHAAVRLLPQITTNTASVPNAPPQPNHISSSGSSSDRSSPTFNTSASSPSPITPDSPHPVLQRRGLIVLATSDNSTWTTVNLSNASTGESVRELIYSAVSSSLDPPMQSAYTTLRESFFLIFCFPFPKINLAQSSRRGLRYHIALPGQYHLW
ncbi:hypothetical protein DL93DRAFT_222940 [Clavulina sp. PMI_390]|nr:hypothetical protein DL93DRAFT_222940 [Clavulina sp. PMI_390]